ncbi:MAG: phosphate-starvation-inducible PsiE family protein [Coriobacteriales bacterium]|nr:phosphate-starvation-inducible PsiE family protein [Coriobacteriales bacterium]
MAIGSSRNQPRLDAAATLLEKIVAWAEGAVALVLAFVIVLAVGTVMYAVVQGALTFPLEGAELKGIITAVLDTFIIIELFRITVAYVRHAEVIPTVLETALVVAAREIVVIEAGKNEPIAGAAVAATLLAIALAWFLLSKTRATLSRTRANEAAQTDEPS